MFEIAEIDPDLAGLRIAILLVPFLLAAIMTDVATRRIPNALIVMMLLSGGLAQISATSGVGEILMTSVGGACVGLLVLFPFYALGGMGAGDVKLLAGVGSFLGPQNALLAGIFTLGAGAVLGLCVLAFRWLCAHWSMRELPGAFSQSDEPYAAIQLPYSFAISAGTLLAVMQW